jgi:hypothetical protein
MLALLLALAVTQNAQVTNKDPPANAQGFVVRPIAPAGGVAVTATGAGSAIDAGTCTNVTGNTTVLAANPARKTAVILNNGSATIYFKLGATATASSPPLAAGQSFVIDGINVYTGQIDAVASSGTQSVCTFSW